MQPVLTAAQSRVFDKYLIEEIGIPSLVLMENAARGALDAIEDWLDSNQEIAILCGPGNNGGDGMALARLLIARSYTVTVFLASRPEKLSPDARIQYDALAKLIDPYEIYTFEKSDDILEIVDSPDIVIDALLGTGSKGMPKDTIAEGVKAIQIFKEGRSKILAIDIPTGIDADAGAFDADESSNTIVRADRTVTMGAPKIGFCQADSKIFTGVISIANLGAEISFPDTAIERAFLVNAEDAARGIRTFRYTASKMDRGRVFTICGSRGMTGAAIMSATAALKSGCGLVTVAVPESQRTIVAQSMPELMTLGLTHESNGSPDLPAWDELRGPLDRADAVLIGCGIPVILGTTALLLRIISQIEKPMVIDAGALGALTGHLDILKARTSPTILTPHVGELARLVERPWQEVERERLEVGRHLAMTYNCIVVVKGEPVQTIASDGTTYINTTGNVGLATGGTGDVLAGMIVSLLAQTPDHSLEATRSAVYLHGLAGDFAAAEKTTHGMTATDVITHLPNAFKALALN
jgi:ADP-dependent NAD(P)H-hydrate dehydratase / NAD(P)H-hydrate epimerase